MSKEPRMIELNTKEKALLVTVDVYNMRTKSLGAEDQADELKELAKTSGVEIMDEIICKIDKPTPNLFIGKGKAEELVLVSQEQNADVLIISQDLSGVQQRNLESELGIKVIDRTQLILDIFAQHAKSPEGKMQVELAQLEYLFPRLTGKGIMLSRLGGGIGTRGPGEQKLEVDRRRIRSRITKLKKELDGVRLKRNLARKKRKAQVIPSIALVGYTNAGKTTLLNTLVKENQLTDNSLFTTLDPLSRILTLPNNQKVLLSDTVGFLHNLPHHLIAAFKATLEDVKEADLLIHVLDISSELRYSHYESVRMVLEELDCSDKPAITALNKIDKLQDLSWLERYKIDFANAVTISALKSENIDALLRAIEDNISVGLQKVEISLPLDKMSFVDLIYREGKVEGINYTNENVVIQAYLSASTIAKLAKIGRIKPVN